MKTEVPREIAVPVSVFEILLAELEKKLVRFQPFTLFIKPAITLVQPQLQTWL